jgi:hypothetical protein
MAELYSQARDLNKLAVLFRISTDTVNFKGGTIAAATTYHYGLTGRVSVALEEMAVCGVNETNGIE